MEIPYAQRNGKKMLRNMTEKTIHDIMTKTDWKDESVHKTCVAIRKYKQALGYSENWMTEYVYNNCITG